VCIHQSCLGPNPGYSSSIVRLTLRGGKLEGWLGLGSRRAVTSSQPRQRIVRGLWSGGGGRLRASELAEASALSRKDSCKPRCIAFRAGRAGVLVTDCFCLCPKESCGPHAINQRYSFVVVFAGTSIVQPASTPASHRVVTSNFSHWSDSHNGIFKRLIDQCRSIPPGSGIRNISGVASEINPLNRRRVKVHCRVMVMDELFRHYLLKRNQVQIKTK